MTMFLFFYYSPLSIISLLSTELFSRTISSVMCVIDLNICRNRLKIFAAKQSLSVESGLQIKSTTKPYDA